MPQDDRQFFSSDWEAFGRDHSTVIHAYNLVARRIANDSAFDFRSRRSSASCKATHANAGLRIAQAAHLPNERYMVKLGFRAIRYSLRVYEGLITRWRWMNRSTGTDRSV